MTPAEEVLIWRARLGQAGPALARRAPHERAQIIETACRSLLEPDSELGRALRSDLALSTGLSEPVIEMGLESTLALFTEHALLALLDGRAARDTAPVVVVLASNLFSAAARPLLLPLFCGRPVLAKAASHDDVFPRYLRHALAAADPELAQACAVVTFSRQDEAAERILSWGARVVSVYGDDGTVAGFAARLSPGARLLAHGHGLGLAFVAGASLGSESDATAVAKALARDIAAYDQRGCLSPQAVLVERAPGLGGARFAKLLHEALEALAQPLPLGEVPATVDAERLQWRGVAAALGTLHAGVSSAVSYEGNRGFRPSPGYRHVAVYDCADFAELRARAGSLGPHVKALGVSEAGLLPELSGLAPYVCALGAMQTPPLSARLDGFDPLEGMID